MNRVLNIAIAIALLIGELKSAEPVKWLSPAGNFSFELSFGKAGEPVLTALANDQSSQVIESPLIASPVTREFGGITWFTDAKSKWIDGRYLALEADDRLALLDAESKQMILNTSFEALSKSPNGDRWSAVRYRPIGRHQERLTDDFRDTLFVIDLHQVIKVSASAKEGSKPFDHLKSLKLPGNALTKPVWVRGAGDELLAVGLWVDGKPIAFALNPLTLDVIEQKVLSISVSDEVAHSSWINREAEPEITRAMLEALSKPPTMMQGSLTSKLPPSVQPSTPNEALEAKHTSTKRSEKPASLTPWSITIVLIVASAGLLWLLLKRRS